MTNQKIWVLVANSAKAKIFQIQKFPKLEELHAFTHPESRLLNQDLVTTPPGRSFDRGGVTRHAYEVTEPKDLEAQKFAKDLGTFLNSHHHKGEFARLYLFASPTFLGLLREHLDKNTHQSIVSQLAKDMTEHKNSEIEAHLKNI